MPPHTLTPTHVVPLPLIGHDAGMDREVFAYGSDDPRPAEETGSAAPTAPLAAPGGRRRGWVVPVLAAGLVFSLALAGSFALLWNETRAIEAEDVGVYLSGQVGEVEGRARELVDLLMNYDATNLDERAEQIRGMSTGTFREDYDELIQQGLGAALEEAAASSRGQIVTGPDVSFRTPSEAIALARVSQTTQSSDNPQGQTFLYVLKVTMVRTNEGWLAGDVEILSEESA